MRISQKTWLNYITKLDQIDSKAAELMTRWVIDNGLDDRNALIEYSYAVCTKYGEAAAALACEMYDAIAMASGVSVPPAVPAETATMQEVAKAVNGSLKRSEVQVPQTVSQLTRRTAADTTLQNAIRDGAQYAWIPHGDTCVFCMVLASKGWQNVSKQTLKKGHAEHIHANCDCQYGVRFSERDSVAGYDPKKYKEMYDNAEGSTPQEKINYMRREQYQADKDRINAMKREAYARRHGIDLSQLGYPVQGYADEHFDRKARKYTSSEDLTATNPNYSKGRESGYQDNCQRCVPTYLLRTQGYDVVANPSNFGNNESIEYVIHRAGHLKYVKSDGTHPRVEFTRQSTTFGKAEIERYMESLEDGAMLEVSCAWKRGGGHVFVAEKRDGIVHYVDPQTGESDVSHYFTLMKKDNTMFFRIDDTSVNEDYIWYIARNSSEKTLWKEDYLTQS